MAEPTAGWWRQSAMVARLSGTSNPADGLA
jgi:hypothetical protein